MDAMIVAAVVVLAALYIAWNLGFSAGQRFEKKITRAIGPESNAQDPRREAEPDLNLPEARPVTAPELERTVWLSTIEHHTGRVQSAALVPIAHNKPEARN